MKIYRKARLMWAVGCWLLAIGGQVPALGQETDTVRKLDEVTVRSRSEGLQRLGGAENGMQIGQDELFRAACCNLGESFVANPSVDVGFTDAAVGARQIKLLGLSGQYVQLLVEGLPLGAGAMMPYRLDYVPGAWMRSIQLSKGAASVKNGFAGITGQIDVEYLKPDEDPGVVLNLYGDAMLRGEGNLVANVHLNSHLSTELLASGVADAMVHDDNGDGWADRASALRYALGNRWKYRKGRYMMHAGVGYLNERRQGGETADGMEHASYGLPLAAYGLGLKEGENRYGVETHTESGTAYMKHALLLNREHNTNLALMSTATGYRFGSTFGHKGYDAEALETSTQLMLEHDFDSAQSLSTGVSLNSERLSQTVAGIADAGAREVGEVVPGVYAQYTYKLGYRLTAMAGVRGDWMSDDLASRGLQGATLHVTPRMHVKWMATDWLTLRASAGKGYRTPRALAENHYLAASGRSLKIDGDLRREEAWNMGMSAAFYLPLGERTVTLGAEYYYTHFLEQMVVDMDTDPTEIRIGNLEGLSYSHTLQLDASCDISDELTTMLALRMNDVKCTYGGKLMEKPLTSRYKGLATVSWKPMMALWQVDVTLQLNGDGRMPAAYRLADGSPSWDYDRYPAYVQLNAQVTREFRHLSIYVGGENLTNYKQNVTVVNAADPWSDTFDPTVVWGPVTGLMLYAGIRMHLGKL